MTPALRTRFLALFILGMVAITAGLVVGQQIVQFGNALDNSLQLGSGGYNQSRLTSPMASQRYTPGMSRPMYTPSNAGGFTSSTHMVFSNSGGYTPTTNRGNAYRGQTVPVTPRIRY